MSTTSMAIFSNPLFATYSVYAHNASIDQNAYLQSRLPGVTVFRSAVSTTYNNGPTPDPWIILAELVRKSDE